MRPRVVVVEDAFPYRGEGADAAPWTAVGAAHFHVTLHPNFGERHRQLVLEVAHRRTVAIDAVGHELAKRGAGVVVVNAVAPNEIHGHVENVLEPFFEPEPVFENHRRESRSLRIGIAPHQRALADRASRDAVTKGRKRKQRGDDGGDGEGSPKRFHHVGFATEIEVRLDCAGALHHVEATGADPRHMSTHDSVSTLRNHRHVIPRRGGMKTHAEKSNSHWAADFLQQCEVSADLVTRLENGFERGARKL